MSSSVKSTTTTSPLQWFDIGANLRDKSFSKDLDSVIEYARDIHGVGQLVLTSTNLDAITINLNLCKKYDTTSNKYAVPPLITTAGIHPHDAKTLDEKSIEIMKQSCAVFPQYIKAIGEAGLDYNRMRSPKEQQLKCFNAQVQLACELQLPLFLHEREAHQDFVQVLDPYIASGKLPAEHVVVHCFTGTETELKAYIKRGFYIGVTGFIAIANRGQALSKCVHLIPLNRLLLETDAPYMTPTGAESVLMQCERGKQRNEPCTIPITAAHIVQCWNQNVSDSSQHITLQYLSEITTTNTKRFFQLSSSQ